MGFVAGWNMPGYMPEVAPEYFAEFKDAKEYLLDTMTSYWDADLDMGIASELEEMVRAAEERWIYIVADLKVYAREEVSQIWNGYTGDYSLHFFIDIAEDDEDECSNGCVCDNDGEIEESHGF